MQYVLRQARQEETAALKQKALEPNLRHCSILKKKVTVLIEYPDYKNPHYKGPEGAIYCKNIIECYQNCVKCRYSGISPLYPDPFLAGEDPDEDSPDDESEADSAAREDEEAEE